MERGVQPLAMILCLFHRVSDRDIRRHVEQGISNFDVLQDETRVASACGACHDCARECFEATLQACESQARTVIAIAPVAA